jgi:tripartite-type tricarboxylate transporter receptor subunit TctC
MNSHGVTKRSLLALPLIAAAALATRNQTLAASYPQSPIRFIIPFTPGGGADTLARLTASFASKKLGQQVYVDNRPGAGGNIAAEVAAKAQPDGYTILEGNLAHAIAMSLYRHVPFDIEKDFAPVIALGSVSFVLAVPPSLPVTSVKDLLTLARKRPGALNYASSGIGGPSHLAMVLFELLSGVKLTHVPYKGAAPAATDLIAGRVQASFLTTPAAEPLMKSGKIRGLAISSSHRQETLPDVPTIAESGVPGYDATTWFGVLVPRGTPDDIVRLLNQSFSAALADAETRKRLQAQGFDIMGGRPEEFGGFVRAQTQKWASVVAAAHIKID